MPARCWRSAAGRSAAAACAARPTRRSAIDAQLDAIAREAVDRRELVFVDRANGVLSVNPMFSWREDAFVQYFADKAAPMFAQRSPLERAVLGLIGPTALRTELDFLEQNQFKMQFHDFDWRLNDLTGR